MYLPRWRGGGTLEVSVLMLIQRSELPSMRSANHGRGGISGVSISIPVESTKMKIPVAVKSGFELPARSFQIPPRRVETRLRIPPTR